MSGPQDIWALLILLYINYQALTFRPLAFFLSGIFILSLTFLHKCSSTNTQLYRRLVYWVFLFFSEPITSSSSLYLQNSCFSTVSEDIEIFCSGSLHF